MKDQVKLPEILQVCRRETPAPSHFCETRSRRSTLRSLPIHDYHSRISLRKIYSAKTITFGSLILLSKEFFRTPRTRRMLKVIRPEAGEDLRSSNASEFSEFRQVSQNLEDEKNGTAFFE
ncbi:MAG: hypothetical protein ABSB80_11145 [Methanoregula sp.]|uniref:hypothetical protein n=1 Tax=Methanoregula sp. TaxID=2052170 RepID=UPI003D0EE437